MLKIRLQRTGREKIPFYRIVIAEHASPVKGKVIDRVGFYNPLIKPWSFEFDKEKILGWIKKGAKPSSTVARLLKAAGVENMDQFIVNMKDRKKKKESAKEESKTEEVPAAKEKPAE